MENEKNPVIHFVYSIFDKATVQYGMPFLDVNDRCAIRRTKAAFQGNPYIEDLVLYKIGEFNYSDGAFTNLMPVSLANLPLLFQEVEEK